MTNDMKLREYRESDLPQLVSLQNEADGNSYEFIPYDEEDIRARLTGASTALVATDARDQIVGLAYLRQDWYGETVTVPVRLGSDENHIRDLLLPAIEPLNKTGTISTSIDNADQNSLAYFTARGYAPESALYQMISDLNRAPPPQHLPEGYLLRSLRPDEEEALIRLANAAYHGDRLRPGILDRWKKQDPDFEVEWVQVAEYEGELVALVAARSDRDYNQHYDARRGYLGPAGTLPDHRGKDLSKALTVRAMNHLRERGLETACLHTWSGNPPAVKLTKDLGFHLDHEWKIMHKTINRTGDSP